MSGGECRIFERPEYAVRGKRSYDQRWIDGNIEAGVGGCGWERPKPRPASMDAPRTVKGVKQPPKKRSIVTRIKERFVPPPAPVVEPVPFVAEPPPPKPRDPVDELLDPSPPVRRIH